MLTLTLKLKNHSLAAALFADGGQRLADGRIPLPGRKPFGSLDADALVQNLRRLCQQHASQSEPDLVVVPVPYGGTEFSGPAFVDDQTLARLNGLASQAPLHIPRLAQVLTELRRAVPGVPIMLLFETTFFSSLPAREASYGLSPAAAPGLRRMGFHGLSHEAAVDEAWTMWLKSRRCGTPAILSLVLEQRPEVAAVLGREPVMVTGGVTPLEGLPGETTCGELDPSLVLSMKQDCGWGPEQINLVLTRESGLRALAERRVTISNLYQDRTPDDGMTLARDVFEYLVLKAAGMAMAAMGGLDIIVVSGRHARAGTRMLPTLLYRLEHARRGAKFPIMSCVSLMPRDEICARLAARGIESASPPMRLVAG